MSKQRLNFTANLKTRVAITQRNTRSNSRLKNPDEPGSVSDELSNFETKIRQDYSSY